MKRIAILIVGVLSCAVLFPGCRPSSKVEISDVGAPQSLTLTTSMSSTYAFEATMRGSLAGEAVLSGFPGKSRSVSLKGNVSYSIPKTDYYLTNLVLTYEPINVTSGKLAIHYRFFSD